MGWITFWIQSTRAPANIGKCPWDQPVNQAVFLEDRWGKAEEIAGVLMFFLILKSRPRNFSWGGVIRGAIFTFSHCSVALSPSQLQRLVVVFHDADTRTRLDPQMHVCVQRRWAAAPPWSGKTGRCRRGKLPEKVTLELQCMCWGPACPGSSWRRVQRTMEGATSVNWHLVSFGFGPWSNCT